MRVVDPLPTVITAGVLFSAPAICHPSFRVLENVFVIVILVLVSTKFLEHLTSVCSKDYRQHHWPLPRSWQSAGSCPSPRTRYCLFIGYLQLQP